MDVGFANLTAIRLPGITGAEVVAKFLIIFISCLSDSSNKPRICEVQISGKTTSGPFIRPSNARALSSFSTTLKIQSIGKISIEVVRFKLSVMPFWIHCTTNFSSLGTFKEKFEMKSASIISCYRNKIILRVVITGIDANDQDSWGAGIPSMPLQLATIVSLTMFSSTVTFDTVTKGSPLGPSETHARKNAISKI